MNFKLIEDFISLAETKNFSKSAKLRNVTQPAFSRRIQQLENWVGFPLIDRSSYPTKLTPAGKIFHDTAEASINAINETRLLLRSEKRSQKNIIRFSAPYTISSYFLPKWLTEIKSAVGGINTKLNANFSYDHFEDLVKKKCDFLICHYHRASPYPLDETEYEYKILGIDKLIPVSATDKFGIALHTLSFVKNTETNFLSYPRDSYLGKVINRKISSRKKKLFLNKIYESATTDSIKRMALEGHGLAWLPFSCIKEEILQKKLINYDERCWATNLEIRIYKSRNNLSDTINNLWSVIPEEKPQAF